MSRLSPRVPLKLPFLPGSASLWAAAGTPRRSPRSANPAGVAQSRRLTGRPLRHAWGCPHPPAPQRDCGGGFPAPGRPSGPRALLPPAVPRMGTSPVASHSLGFGFSVEEPRRAGALRIGSADCKPLRELRTSGEMRCSSESGAILLLFNSLCPPLRASSPRTQPCSVGTVLVSRETSSARVRLYQQQQLSRGVAQVSAICLTPGGSAGGLLIGCVLCKAGWSYWVPTGTCSNRPIFIAPRREG